MLQDSEDEADISIQTGHKWTVSSVLREAEERLMVQKEIQEAGEEDRQSKAAAMTQQGSWTPWDSARLVSGTVGHLEYVGHRIKFVLCSIYDFLPTLMYWFITNKET